ncbi:hypothetical protein O0L34_g4234 [Tuta absoluta]|nr:hypothetical protein O0L34_g4234 [Tuta absoluta]
MENEFDFIANVVCGLNQRSTVGCVIITTIHVRQAPPPSFVVFAENRPPHRLPPSPLQPAPHLPRGRCVTHASIKASASPPLQLRRMEYSVEVVWHERALC